MRSRFSFDLSIILPIMPLAQAKDKKEVKYKPGQLNKPGENDREAIKDNEAIQEQFFYLLRLDELPDDREDRARILEIMKGCMDLVCFRARNLEGINLKGYALLLVCLRSRCIRTRNLKPEGLYWQWGCFPNSEKTTSHFRRH